MAFRHKLYDKRVIIEDKEKQLIHIPIYNKYQKFVGYAISNLQYKDLLLQYTYHLTTYRNKSYVHSNKILSMHELVMGKKAPEGFIIDHINGNTLDNRIENLRFAKYDLNSQNKPKKPNATCEYIGVCKVENKWKAAIHKNNKQIHLGYFESPIEAGKIYDIHATDQYKGEARTNGLLTEAEIDDILLNGIPEEYQIIKKERDLPKYICRSFNGYSVEIKKDKKRYIKYVKTLEEALIIKEQFLKEIKDLEKTQEKERVKNITRNKDGLAIIIMNNGQECIVDDHVWPDVSKISWCTSPVYPRGKVNEKTIALHRYIYMKYINPIIPKGLTVDHINTKIFDARVQNLRLADASLQAHNKNISKNRVEKYKGVSFSNNKYRVCINKKHYGCYDTAEQAAEKANEVFKTIYGDNARLNIIDYDKTTTRENRIEQLDNLTRESILNLKTIVDLRNLINIKKLNTGKRGPIAVKKINLDNFDDHKKLVVDLLFPINDIKLNKEVKLTREFIMSLTKIVELKKIIINNKLNTMCYNEKLRISVHKIKSDNLESYKIKVANLLFSTDNTPLTKIEDIKTIIDENTREFILNLTRLIDLRNYVIKNNLNNNHIRKSGIPVRKINSNNFNEYKNQVADLLFPL